MLSLLSGVASHAKTPGEELYALPAGFNKWSPSFSLYRTTAGAYRSTYDLTADLPSGTVKYISPNGNNGNSGDDAANPYKDITAATAAGATVVWFLDGYYDRDVFSTTSGHNFTADIALRAINPGKVFMGRSNSFSSWAQESAPNDNVYSVSRSSARKVFDDTYRATDKLLADGSGRLRLYTEQVSIANCQANPGSFFISGSTVYVHTWDSRAPDTDIKITLAENNIAQTSAITLWCEGIVFYGEAPVRFTQSATNSAKFVAVDCVFCFENDGDALDINDVSDIRLIRCGAHDTGNDGFNYHTDSAHATITKSLEVDCWAREIGNTGATNDNASSMHDAGAIIRLNGDYSDSYGPVVVDSSASHSVNLNVTASNNLIDNDSSSDTGFQSLDTNTLMWLQDCTTVGSMHYDRSEVSGGQITDLGSFSGVAGQDFGTIS